MIAMAKDKNFRFYWEGRHDKKEPDIRIEVPGFKKDEITVTIQNNMLSVSGRKKSHKVEKGRGFYRESASSSSFQKSVTLPLDLTPGNFEPVVRDGAVEIKKKKKKIVESA